MCGASAAGPAGATAWLEEKLRHLAGFADAEQTERLCWAVLGQDVTEQAAQFINPFHVADLLALDGATLMSVVESGGVSLDDLAVSLRDLSAGALREVDEKLPPEWRVAIERAQTSAPAPRRVAEAQCRVLDACFWELTYWRTPELYDELTAGETLHPGIFARLAPHLRNKVALDAGAGAGRATYACLEHGARHVYAVEASPGLRSLFGRKLAGQPEEWRVSLLAGRFDDLPLPDASVDIVVACSCFTRQPASGGEPGLREFRRVTRPGGLIAVIWPRPVDFHWLAGHGFAYVALPLTEEPRIRFRSFESAWRCASRFYGRNARVLAWLRETRQSEIPFSLVGSNPPHDYCWLKVT